MSDNAPPCSFRGNSAKFILEEPCLPSPATAFGTVQTFREVKFQRYIGTYFLSSELKGNLVVKSTTLKKTTSNYLWYLFYSGVIWRRYLLHQSNELLSVEVMSVEVISFSRSYCMFVPTYKL